MDFSIPDEVVQETGLSKREILAELACCLFDSDKLDFNAAAHLAGFDRVEFEHELRSRGLPTVHYTEEDFREDLETIAYLERKRRGNAA